MIVKAINEAESIDSTQNFNPRETCMRQMIGGGSSLSTHVQAVLML